jgi:iron complex outermembrane receptor protein
MKDSSNPAMAIKFFGFIITTLALNIGFVHSVGAQGTLEEIVVTAQFREQNLQETPLAITAISGDMLEARSQVSIIDVANQAPNVTLKPGSAPFGPSAQAFIRGVGQSDFNFALEPGVGMYVDDVYYSTLAGSIFDLIDLDRIEILRGPQGTLAGQNSIGGAVKLFSKKPDGTGGGFVQATYGSYDRTEFRGAAEFTLIPDELFARVAGVSVNKDGYVTRYDYACTHPGTPIPSFQTKDKCELGTEGGKAYTGLRGLMRWTPTDRLEVNLIGDYTNDDSEASPFTLLYVGELDGPGVEPTTDPNLSMNGVLLGTVTGSPFISFSPYGNFAQDTFKPGDPYINYSTYANPTPKDGTPGYSIPAQYQVDSYGGSATIDFQLTDNLSLKSITAYRRYAGRWSIDEDGAPLGATTIHNDIWHRQLSEEVRLSGTLFDDKVNFTLGGFYFDQDSHYGGRIDLLSLQFLEKDDIPGDTQAVFTNVEWDVNDALTLIGGIRYTEIEKTFSFGRLGIPGNARGGAVDPRLAPINGLDGKFSGTRTDYRAVIQYQWTDDIMTYAQYATGFKSGGINPRPFFPEQVLPHDPETLDAYEIGFKSNLFDNRMRLNISAFFNDYQGILMTVNQCERPATPPFFGTIGAPCAKPVNAGEADVSGIEVEAEFYPVEGLSVDASLSYLDFEYQKISPAAQASGITIDMRAPFSPEWQYSVGVQYEFPLGNWGTLTPRLDLSYQDSFFSSAINSPPFNSVASYTLLNGRVTWRSSDEDWQLALEVTNMTDELYYLGIFDNRGSSKAIQGQPAPPAQWAVTLKRSF